MIRWVEFKELERKWSWPISRPHACVFRDRRNHEHPPYSWCHASGAEQAPKAEKSFVAKLLQLLRLKFFICIYWCLTHHKDVDFGCRTRTYIEFFLELLSSCIWFFGFSANGACNTQECRWEMHTELQCEIWRQDAVWEMRYNIKTGFEGGPRRSLMKTAKDVRFQHRADNMYTSL